MKNLCTVDRGNYICGVRHKPDLQRKCSFYRRNVKTGKCWYLEHDFSCFSDDAHLRLTGDSEDELIDYLRSMQREG